MSSAPLSSEVPALSPAIATDAEHIASSTDSTSSSKGKEPGSAIQPQDQKQPPHPEQKPRREGQEPLAADSTEGTPLPDSSVVHPQTQGNILDQTTGAGASSNPTPSHILSSSSHPSNPAGSRPQMSKQNPPVKITLVPAAQDSEKDQDGVVRGQTPTTESGVSPATKQETHKTKPLSPSSSEVKRVKSPVKHKQSFWSSLFAGLLPCISPSKAHPVDIEHLQAPRDSASTDAVSGARKAQVVSLQDAKEKEAGAEADKHSTEPSTSTSTTTPAPLQIPRSTTPLYDPELPLHTAPPTPTRSSIRTGGHVIVPPSPHHLLPEAETEGLTSGAVQPPGSTGRESEDLQFGEGEEGAGDELRQAEEEGADGTVGGGGTTIGEGTVIEEDDEERLILQGGVGIPIVVS
jgi:RNA polymerase II subunit A small phosphatase-like protein